MSKLISFEGIDGSGKSTQIKHAYDFLIDRGYSVDLYADPGSTQLGEILRKELLYTNTPVCKKSELFMFLAARAQMVEEKISKSKADFILLDRYIDSTLFYQGLRNGFKLDLVWSLALFGANDYIPDATLIFDINEETFKKRIKTRDKQENYDVNFVEKVHNFINSNEYYELNKFIAYKPRNIYIIDANLPISDVNLSVEVILTREIEKTRT